MSREDWEVFDLMREERRVRKEERLFEAESELMRLAEVARLGGLSLSCPAGRHWQLRDGTGGLLADYWPSTQKMRYPGKNSTLRGVRLSDFEMKMRALCAQW